MKCAKTTYSTQAEADLDIKRISEKSKRQKVPTRSYKCEKCGLFHLTSRPDYKQKYENAMRGFYEILNENKKLTEQIIKLNIKQNREIKTEAKKNELVKQLNHQLNKAKQTIKRLRADNQQFIIQKIKNENTNKNN